MFVGVTDGIFGLTTVVVDETVDVTVDGIVVPTVCVPLVISVDGLGAAEKYAYNL